MPVLDESMLASKVEEEMRRMDDSFLRKIAIGVVSAVVVQFFFSIYFAGTLSNQVGNNTKAIEIFAERLKSQDATAVALEKVKTLVEVMALDKAKNDLKFETIVAEQQRLAINVERALLVRENKK